MSAEDSFFMGIALEEARKGLGRTSPNPSVGAVVVRDGKIVGRGYHKKAGTPHAEVHALVDAGELARGATIYVTLEPCNHTGRTPPCSHAVLEAGIVRVVIGQHDPNPIASGGGSYLLANGLEVLKGVREEECRQLNYPFIKHVNTGMPWVVMKAGMSLDGRISYQKGSGGPITGKQSWNVVHSLRNQLDAILIGIETATIDDPSLTTRLEGQKGKDPLRVVLDSHLRLSPDSKMLKQESAAATWVFCTTDASKEKEERLLQAGAVIHRVATTTRNRLDLEGVLKVLGKNNILSLLVEGGAGVHGSFLQQRLVDEVYLFVAPFFIGSAGTALLADFSTSDLGVVEKLVEVDVQRLGVDTLLHGLFPERVLT